MYENKQPSGRPEHITHDHSYSYGWHEMEKPEFCMDVNCLKARKDQQRIIDDMRERIATLEQELELCQTKLLNASKVNKGLRHTDLKTNKLVRICTGIPTKEAFHKLFDFVKKETPRKSTFGVALRNLIERVGTLKEHPRSLGQNEW